MNLLNTLFKMCKCYLGQSATQPWKHNELLQLPLNFHQVLFPSPHPVPLVLCFEFATAQKGE